jgi:secreted trypsin-like serine protease
MNFSLCLSHAKLWVTLLSVSLSFFKIAADQRDDFHARIVNGAAVKSAFSASFFARPAPVNASTASKAVCGATLIHTDMILTAAHCWSAFHHGVLMYDVNTNDFTRKVPIDRQIRHPKWDFYGDHHGSLNFDFLLLRLATPVAEGDVVKPMSFNSNPNIPTSNGNHSTLTVYGYGKTENGTLSHELRQATVQYISNEECTKRFEQNGVSMNVTLPNEFMCTTAKMDGLDVSTCSGDSGGPVTTNVHWNGTSLEVLVGVVSAGIGCSTELFPNGNARLSTAARWIEEQICRYSRDSSPLECIVDEPFEASAVEIRLVVTFDSNPEQTLYAIRSMENRSIVFTGPQDIAEHNRQLNTTFFLDPGDYAFEAYDVKGDGMMKSREDDGTAGWQLYEVHFTAPIDDTSGKANKIVIKSETLLARGDGNFTEKQVTPFTVGDPAQQAESSSQKVRIIDRPGQAQEGSSAARSTIRGKSVGK